MPAKIRAAVEGCKKLLLSYGSSPRINGLMSILPLELLGGKLQYQLEFTCETRTDKKGRTYYFLKPRVQGQSFMSATVFPAPSGTTHAIYIWWQKHSYKEVGDELVAVRKAWVKRYLFLNEIRMAPQSGVALRLIDNLMQMVENHKYLEQRRKGAAHN